MQKINRIAIVGGTHGNEFTGAFLVKKFEKYPNLVQKSNFETLTILGNPQAFNAGRRYIEKDLNRCFLHENLQNSNLTSYEDIRAKEIAKILKEDNQTNVDLIIDLHSTTANMGLSIILGNQHPFLLRLSTYLSAINPLVKVCYTIPENGSNFLRSLSELGFVIEVGAVAQGVLNADLFQKTEQLIYTILDYLEKHNHGKIAEINQPLTLYKFISTVDYPRNENGEIQAMIHPDLQFRDYEPLNPGDPLFLTLDGKAIAYEGTSTVYPIFINEAAYYEKGIAMLFTEKQILSI
ncbi:aspartoacylase [Nostoc sp. NIES-3756]|uniref:aspartoacylase n=1 Tax=Nostoc sp. NIES-3756 TaxID=1751286 RepID=UPI0007212FD6|nr:aspartoacylase [Nostoc sp. NIES-3756]BAT54107.1 aspartoacylase [Nostoc sp. NIES-3756]BAY38153.1 aspartoacylase [Nostoc sp. NIES-2111]